MFRIFNGILIDEIFLSHSEIFLLDPNIKISTPQRGKINTSLKAGERLEIQSETRAIWERGDGRW